MIFIIFTKTSVITIWGQNPSMKVGLILANIFMRNMIFVTIFS